MSRFPCWPGLLRVSAPGPPTSPVLAWWGGCLRGEDSALVRSDPYHSQHASGLALLLAMREVLARAAGSAAFKRRDVRFRYAHGEQLTAVGFAQIKMQLDALVAMAGRTLVHEEHGIFLPHRIGLLHAMKKVGGIIELRVKSLFHFRAHLKAAVLDSRADHG